MIRPFRQEIKFLVHYSVRGLLLERWGRFLVRAPFTDPHAVTCVLSQYFDSPVLDFYQEKLAGVRNRNKVRLRTYGSEFRPGQPAFLEIKYRDNEHVRKYRYPVRKWDASWLDPSRWRIDDREVEDVFSVLNERYRLRRSAQVYYQREAYEGAVERDVRVTFDSAVTALHPGERVRRDLLFNSSRRLLSDTLVILEIKATRGLPSWIHEGVRIAELRQDTIPKYVAAVEALRLPEQVMTGVYV